MKKTTVYLPDELKRRVEFAAHQQGRSEAEIIRDAIDAAVKPQAPEPKIPLFRLRTNVADRVDELLAEGFGED